MYHWLCKKELGSDTHKWIFHEGLKTAPPPPWQPWKKYAVGNRVNIQSLNILTWPSSKIFIIWHTLFSLGVRNDFIWSDTNSLWYSLGSLWGLCGPLWSCIDHLQSPNGPLWRHIAPLWSYSSHGSLYKVGTLSVNIEVQFFKTHTLVKTLKPRRQTWNKFILQNSKEFVNSDAVMRFNFPLLQSISIQKQNIILRYCSHI